MDNKAKLVERARKLYAMSQDSSSPAEAEIAQRRVTKMMEEHGITAADLDDATTAFGKVAAGKRYKQRPTWYGVLSMGVAKYHDCQIETIDGMSTFKGFEKDVAVAPLTLDYLVGTMERGVKRYQKENKSSDPFDYWKVTPRQMGSSYRNGFASEMQTILYNIVAERTKEQRAALESDGAGTALVIQKNKLVEGEFGVQLTKKANMRYYSEGATNAGRAAAQNTSLSKQVGGSTQRRLA